ncbi:uncharacterized protein PFLUO_LOCUS9392 [Penicillium psychrofluorescens]|uniref:uncharacterized protein n=1 Tax=Penicillium psychrofluorescens TaxID=3158075 RepID=UPI003CCCE4C6
MQFALPPRRSPAPPYAHSSRFPRYRRKQLKTVAVLAIAVFTILYLLPRLFSSSSPSVVAPAGTASVVIVTVIDREQLSESYIKKIVENREDYAKRHGYANFFTSTSDYADAINDAPQTWAAAPALRHAMATYPYSTYFFHLSAHALIMNPSKSLKSHLLDKARLESLMLKDLPVVPPDSIIRTFSHLKANDVDLIMTQDGEDISPGSFVLRQGDFARFFLDLWFDPLYRSYMFAKAETHGLDHIIQWHPTILARLAMVPQRILNSYSKDSPSAGADGTYQDGDFVVRFHLCESTQGRDCEDEMESYYKLWQSKAKSQ